MTRYANYVIEQENNKFLLIRDQGPWDLYFTVTNDAENVVQRLFDSGRLKADQRVLYYDSDGELGELIIKDRKFSSFGVADESTIRRLASIEEHLENT